MNILDAFNVVFGTTTEESAAIVKYFKTIADIPTTDPRNLKGEISEESIEKIKNFQYVYKVIDECKGAIVPEKISTAEDAYEYMRKKMGYLDHEEVWLISLAPDASVISTRMVTRGTSECCPVFPKEILREALLAGAYCIIVLHNHPTGDPTPSVADIETTKRLIASGDQVGINILDHVIIARDKYSSVMAHLSGSGSDDETKYNMSSEEDAKNKVEDFLDSEE